MAITITNLNYNKMKKVLLAIGIVAMVFLGASCNKQKTCHCTYTVEVLGVSTTTDLGDYTIEVGNCSDLEDCWKIFIFSRRSIKKIFIFG